MKWAVLLIPAVALAQTPAEQRGKKIIQDCVAALGGEKFLKMEDRVEAGRAYSFYRDQISGLSIAKIYTRYITVPDGKSGEALGVREREAFGKNEDSGSVLFTENSGWEITFRGAKELPKDRFERYRDSTLRNIFYIFRQRLNEQGMIFEYRSSGVFENQPVDIVDVIDAQDRVVTVYIHQSTHLPLRQVYSRKNPETKEQDQEVTSFSRYRETSGVQWPQDIRRERNGEKIYEIFSESVAINKDLTDEIFSLPVEGAATPKPKRK